MKNLDTMSEHDVWLRACLGGQLGGDFGTKDREGRGIEICIIRVRSCAFVVPLRGAVSRHVMTLSPSV